MQPYERGAGYDAAPPLEAVAAPPALPRNPLARASVRPFPRRSPRHRAAAEPARGRQRKRKPEQPRTRRRRRFLRSCRRRIRPATSAKTTDDIAAAEANLQRASGRQLNAAQQDLVEKIRSFFWQSRDAGKGGDWVRAQNLSQKARLLSAELIDSF